MKPTAPSRRDRSESPSARRRFIRGSTLLAAGWVAGGWSPGSRAADGGEQEKLPPSTRFLRAVESGRDPEVARRLEDDPGLLHTRDAEGRSAYALALLAGHGSTATLLLERGYGPDLHEAALAVDWERFERLAAETPGRVNLDHPVGGTAMYAAARGGAGKSIWRVYRYGGDPDARPRGPAAPSPLHAALEHADLGTAEMTAATLLGNGADPNLPQPGGDSPLHVAARRGSFDLVEMLLRTGADPAARDAGGATPEAAAREAGHGATADLLARHREIPRDRSTSRRAFTVDGEPYGAPDLSAFSAVERGKVVGASHGNLDAVREAVRRNPPLAHAVATTTEGAVEAGAHMGRTDIVEFLLEQGVPCSLPTAVMRNDLAAARRLLQQDPLRIHERGAHGFALLWYPVIGGGLMEMLELLLSAGADVERQHVLGTTALHWAAMRGMTSMAERLIEAGARVDRVGRNFDAAGQTPLQLAEARDHDETVSLLRARAG